MAEEINIGNVGGDGVASEVTMLRLASAVEKMAGGGSGGKKAAAELRNLQNSASDLDDTLDDLDETADKAAESFREAGEAAGKLSRSLLGAIGGGIGGLLTSFGGLANEAIFGGESMSDFTRHIPIFGSMLGGLTGIFDQNLDSFRQMSNSGAIFGEGLNGLRNMAANAGIPLAEFGDLVSSNSQRMTYFGGGVASGTVQFAKMAKELRTGPGRTLMGLGYTAQELNESLLDYAEFNQRQARTDGRNAKLSAASAAEYLAIVDETAAVTGKRRDQIKEEMNTANQDARSRAAIARMTGKAGIQFAANLANTPDAIADALRDQADGIANNPLTRGLIVASETFRTQSQDIQNMNAAEYSEFMVNVRKDLDIKSGEMGLGLDAVIASGSDIGLALDVVGTLSDKVAVSQEDALKIATARAAEVKADQSQKLFGDSLRTVRTDLMAAFSLGPDSPLGAAGMGLESFTKMFTDLAGSDGFKATATQISDVFKSVVASVQTFIDDWQKTDLMTALMGSDGEGGLMENLFKEDSKLMTSFQKAADWVSTNVGPVIGNMFSSMISNLLPDWDTIVVGAITGLGVLLAAPFIGAAAVAVAPFVAIFVGIGAMFGWEALKDKATAAWDSLTGAFSGISDWWDNLDVFGPITEWWDTVDFLTPLTDMWAGFTGVFTGIGDWWATLDFLTPITDMWAGFKGIFTGIGDWWATVDFMAPISEAWTKFKGFFSFGESSFSISQVATDAWTKFKGFFSFGESSFSISQLATDAWKTVTGFFSFGTGEEGSGFSISQLATDAWSTITGFFSFEGFELPSISGMFQGIIDAVKGFFTFDFKLPNFKSFLPKWLGGSGATLDGVASEGSGSTAPSAPDTSGAIAGGEALVGTQGALAQFASLPDLENNLAALKKGLDINGVTSYTSAMEDLVVVLGKMNDELTKDNSWMPGSNGVNAGSIVSQQGAGGGSDQLNSTMALVLAELQAIKTADESTAKNTKNFASSNIARGGLTNVTS